MLPKMAKVVTAAINYWPDSRCAKAFWGQHELPPYRRLLADTVEWAALRAGEAWLDLGCGGGALTRAIWDATSGQVSEVVGSDVAAVNANAYRKLREELQPPPGDRVRFVTHDFSAGLGPFADGSFDGVISGLSISYAESFDESTGTWTTAAYDRLLSEVYRILRPGGRFVFSVNVPDPAWGRVAWHSLAGVRSARRPLKYLKKAWRMLRYGAWLKKEARKGRFHYLPADAVTRRLDAVGFTSIGHRLTYVGQAFVFRCRKPESTDVVPVTE
ncbi:MAG TPA: methyltransferase domain-containing protein [Gemmataceae bacterium]|nr:methyltransferase domain-containing protein [Gemmataceae bacterium]